ncbi:MAG: hypothetical protein CM15mP68_6050 [Pseudomonadota bacterium]|nr:MAG: hypothetical protein CM15mP68_6050 [Pseudomonadota bacterium]
MDTKTKAALLCARRGAAAQREFIETFDQQFKPSSTSTNITAQALSHLPAITATSAVIGCRLDAMLVDKPLPVGTTASIVRPGAVAVCSAVRSCRPRVVSTSALSAIAAVVIRLAEDELFTSVMHKYQPWQEGAPGVTWSPQLRGHSN